MLESGILQKMQGVAIEERIRIIEMILQSLKQDLRASNAQAIADQHPLRGTVRHYEDPYNSAEQPRRPAFGFMKSTGTIQGDIISPAVPESDWEVLQCS
jgi:hypothetical protein